MPRIRKPQTSYFLFSHHVRPSIKEDYAGATLGSVAKLIAARWGKMTEEQKAVLMAAQTEAWRAVLRAAQRAGGTVAPKVARTAGGTQLAARDWRILH